MGDDVCLVCPKWDRKAGKPFPEPDHLTTTLYQIADLMAATQTLPRPGGILNQQPWLMELLAAITKTDTWRHQHGLPSRRS